jgi:hypothetical protein
MGVIGGVVGTGAIAAAKTVSSGYKKVGLPQIPGISAWSGTDKDMQDLQKAYQQTSQFGYGIGEMIPSYGLEPTIKSTISTGKAIFTKEEDPIVNEIAQGWQEAKGVIGQQISPEQAKAAPLCSRASSYAAWSYRPCPWPLTRYLLGRTATPSRPLPASSPT